MIGVFRIDELEKENEKLREELERVRGALEFYAAEANWKRIPKYGGSCEIAWLIANCVADRGGVARAALGEGCE